MMGAASRGQDLLYTRILSFMVEAAQSHRWVRRCMVLIASISHRFLTHPFEIPHFFPLGGRGLGDLHPFPR